MSSIYNVPRTCFRFSTEQKCPQLRSSVRVALPCSGPLRTEWQEQMSISPVAPQLTVPRAAGCSWQGPWKQAAHSCSAGRHQRPAGGFRTLHPGGVPLEGRQEGRHPRATWAAALCFLGAFLSPARIRSGCTKRRLPQDMGLTTWERLLSPVQSLGKVAVGSPSGEGHRRPPAFPSEGALGGSRDTHGSSCPRSASHHSFVPGRQQEVETVKKEGRGVFI